MIFKFSIGEIKYGEISTGCVKLRFGSQKPRLYTRFVPSHFVLFTFPQ